jgi:hypothetical protein
MTKQKVKEVKAYTARLKNFLQKHLLLQRTFQYHSAPVAKGISQSLPYHIVGEGGKMMEK